MVRTPVLELTVDCSLPTTLDHPDDIALERKLAETQTAQPELPHIRPWPPAEPAPVTLADLELRRRSSSRNFRSRRHIAHPQLSA